LAQRRRRRPRADYKRVNFGAFGAPDFIGHRSAASSEMCAVLMPAKAFKKQKIFHILNHYRFGAACTVSSGPAPHVHAARPAAVPRAAAPVAIAARCRLVFRLQPVS